MDKREEDILDDILDGEESGDFTETEEIEETEETEEIEIPETLRGEQNDEPESENKDENKNESESGETPADLSDFIDDNTEIDLTIDPDLDRALSEFADDDSDKKENNENTEEIKITARKKAKKLKLIRNISLICLAAVLVIGGGLFAFYQIDKIASNNIVTIDKEKVTVEDLKLAMILNIIFQKDSQTPKESAIDMIIYSMVLNKAAKERDINFTEEEKDYLTSYIEYIKNDLGTYNIVMPSVTDERFEIILGYTQMNSIQYRLMEKVAEDAKYTVNESAFASELESFRLNDKLLKYIITYTQEEADEAVKTVLSGELSFDEAVIKYSLAYDENNGISQVNLSQIGFGDEENGKIMNLKETEISDPIDIGGAYAVFKPASNKETEEWLRESYISNQKWQLFDSEYELWEKETKIVMNEKSIGKFDENAFLDKFWEAVQSGQEP